MYIYNVTTNIEKAVHKEWVEWMKETHIPNILATGKFLNAKMTQVMVEEEMGGVTYSVQYTTVDKQTLEKYLEEDSTHLFQQEQKKFPNKFVSFSTELKVVSEH
ncbi:DUF4286 family protein [Euzebyella saccharophila]|uniref:DUF4286 family protein n=1 Tax=Euzebyella saccharophila TaxID=679664 RepID=A0ABV8JMF3_9FLAO|nr:DUF4286 family protein [Euzebyella saccharophila]